MTPDSRQTRSEQREEARNKARQLREQNKRKEAAKKITLRIVLVGGVLAIVAAVASVLLVGANSPDQNVSEPANVSFNDGIKIGAGLKAFTDTSTPSPSFSPTPGSAAVPNIVMYIDYQCPVCQRFESANTAQIRSWVDAGAATVEIHPISFLDGASANKYSSRATNAAICVATYSPDNFFDFSSYLFANQPAEGTAGPENKDLVAATVAVAVTNAKKIESCINNKSFASWIKSSTTKAMSENVPGTDVPVKGTPSVYVNGHKYDWQTNEDLISAARFQQFVQQASATE